ncbi:MAG: hypothetical protein H0W03_05420 [Solirubrobacterales bacterium]|nr:hypothetical protein [Solirubrobacterales bacterium]
MTSARWLGTPRVGSRSAASNQQALRDYIADGLGGQVTATQYPEGGTGRITGAGRVRPPPYAYAVVGRLAAVAIGGQIAFVASWLTAQALEPRYDSEGETVSGLAAASADNPWIVTLGLVAWALGTAAC